MSLWEDVNVRWRWSSILGYYAIADINWANRGWWSLDWRYHRENMTGPSPSSGSYISSFNVVTTGEAWYLTGKWRNTTVTHWNNVGPGVTNPSWGCS